MPSSGSVTFWIGRLKAGDAAAAQKLWEAYFRRLVGLARKKLQGVPRRAADEEDVVLSAFDSFCQGVGRDRFPRLQDREDLWQVLVLITARKAIDLRQHEGRAKRGGGAGSAEPAILEQVVGREPTPEFAAQVAEECRHLLEKLGNRELRTLALWKMEGYTTEEIASRLGCVPRTVERKLRVIRSLWGEEQAP
jgi:RNA polymerase sigma factor (sigma-70 family)